MSFVLDASVVVAWLVDDEDDPLTQTALTKLETEVALVPHVWHIELRSALLGAERRRRLRPDEVDECLHRVGELPVRTDPEPDIDTAFALARARRLSVYDALYLELAVRTDSSLATLDHALSTAALAEALTLVGPGARPRGT